MIKAILACDDYGGISKNGTLPWPHNSTDLKWFKSNTFDQVVVMGSTTWEDPHMPRPLPGRMNVLVTRRESEYFGSGAPHKVIYGDLNWAVPRLDTEHPGKDTWIIGGVNIIEQTLGVIEEFYLSRIPGAYACDTFLPLKKIESLFEKTWSENHDGIEFEIWKKRK